MFSLEYRTTIKDTILRTTTTGMSSYKNIGSATSDGLCKCKEGQSCANCSSSDLTDVMSELLGKINTLTSQVTVITNRLQLLEVNKSEVSECSENNIGNKSCDRVGQPIEADVIGKSRKQIRKKKVKRKSKEREKCSQSEEESVSENGSNCGASSKRPKHKPKKRYFSSEAHSSTEDDSGNRTSASSGSGGKARKKRKRRRRVKSGAKVKHRPVVRTELWPHTISNENEGENITSEDISLAKFLSCFSYIITTSSSEIEAAGRALLLHAVSTVLECLPWAEARSFHNLVMLKIEQGRINWTSDFLALADQFLTKKVRKTLRASTFPACNFPFNAYRNNTDNKGFQNSNLRSNFNSNYSANNFNNVSNNSQHLYSFVCKQWNSGKCSYGDNCRRWHTCWSCAEGGKLGEPHMAVSHENSVARSRQDNQCF